MSVAAFFTWFLLFLGLGSPPPCGDDITPISSDMCEAADGDEQASKGRYLWFGLTNDISNGI